MEGRFKQRKRFIEIIRAFITIAPFLLFGGILTHSTLPVNQGEYPENWTFIFVATSVMILNSISIVTLWIIDSERNRINKILNAFSILFGTPVVIILWLGYHQTLRMNINIEETQYLRGECFMKWRNIYKSENRYHFSSGYCPTATQDSIIVTEIYRWGNVKSCGIILNGVYQEINESEVTFLTENQKKEIMSY